jgi:hypothetical protein
MRKGRLRLLVLFLAFSLAAGACGNAGSSDSDLVSGDSAGPSDSERSESPLPDSDPSASQPSTTGSPAPDTAPSTSRPPQTTVAPTTTARVVPENADAVRFDGADYWCEANSFSTVDSCVRASFPVPDAASFFNPDVWCDFNTCTYYNPDDYIEVTFASSSYICEAEGYSYTDQYNCQTYLGGRPPPFLSTDIYCSGSEWARECSTLWYPDELAQYELTTVNGRDHLCKDAWQGGYGDLDCYTYSGGDPSFVGGSVAAYCSSSGSFLDCSDEWYPNELDRYDFTRINGSDHVCKDALTTSWGDQDCFRYYGGDPNSATFGLPNQYCSGDSFSMTCDPYDYPSAIEAAIEAEWDDYSIIRIDYSEYICDDGAFGDTPCVRYSGGSPSRYSFWNPDYLCERWGSSCEPG